MNVLSWNVNGSFPPAGSPDRIASQIDWLASLKSLPDILLLQEVNPERQELWHKSLQDDLGYRGLTDTINWARDLDNSNGHITAVTEDWELSHNKFGPNESGDGDGQLEELDTEFPEKILITDIDHPETNLEVLNIRAVPGSSHGVEKHKIQEIAFDWIEQAGQQPRILAGDLNTPKAELADGQAITFGYDRTTDLRHRGVTTELKLLKGLGHFGMVDVFRYLNGYQNVDKAETSHDAKRFDHMFASEALDPLTCYYDHDGLKHSDHAPVIAEFGLGSSG